MIKMNNLKKLEILGSSAKYDICASTSVTSRRKMHQTPKSIGYKNPAGCCHVFTPDGRCVSLFKVLMTNKCTNDCFYCQNSTSCNKKQVITRFNPEELVSLFLEFYKRNLVEGLFLSSGIAKNTDSTMENMIQIGNLLRNKYHFQGYIHMKILPGAHLSDIKAIAGLADRLSLNMEAPSKQYLHELCSTKHYTVDLATRLAWMHGINKHKKISAGITTQMIIGGNNASDYEILKNTNQLYEKFNLKRVYYSAFHPIHGSPLEKINAAPLLREHRLYQADWLLRVYRFRIEEILPETDGNLSLKVDPKISYAISHYDEKFPVDVNESSYSELLYVPGIGPKSAKRIIQIQKNGEKIEKESTLKKLGVVISRARPFIKVNGQRYTRLDEWLPKVEKHGMIAA